MAKTFDTFNQLQKANAQTSKLIDANNEAKRAAELEAAQERQNRFNDYYMRLNGRVTRDDAESIFGSRVSKDDYNSYLDNAKQYATTQPKKQLTNLLDFQNAIYDRQEARNELDMLNEKRRVQRETLGRGIGEVSAIIGDMIKASKGATVFPRQFDQQLATLDQRSRDAYKLYNANQLRIDQDRINALAAAQAQAAAEKAREQAQANKDRDFNEGVRQFDLTLDYKKNRDKDKINNTVRLAYIKNENKDRKVDYLGFNGEQYVYPKGKGKAIATDLIGRYWDKLPRDLLTTSLNMTFSNGKPIIGPGVTDSNAIATFGQAFGQAILNGSLSDEDIKNISNELIIAMGESFVQPSGSSTPKPAGEPEPKKVTGLNWDD